MDVRPFLGGSRQGVKEDSDDAGNGGLNQLKGNPKIFGWGTRGGRPRARDRLRVDGAI